MEIKINWGKGLIIGMGAFMLFIIGLGVAIFNEKGDDYDLAYYEKGLDYNNDYGRERRVLTEGVKPNVQLVQHILNVGFKGPAKGMLHLQRPSDKSLDKHLAFSADPEGMVEISLQGYTRGRWQLVFEWEAQNKQYLYQQEVFIP